MLADNWGVIYFAVYRKFLPVNWCYTLINLKSERKTCRMEVIKAILSFDVFDHQVTENSIVDLKQ